MPLPPSRATAAWRCHARPRRPPRPRRGRRRRTSTRYSRPAIPEGVSGVRRLCRAPGADEQENLVAGVDPGVRRLGEHRRRAGHRGYDGFGAGNQRVGTEDDQDREQALAPGRAALIRGPTQGSGCYRSLPCLSPVERVRATGLECTRDGSGAQGLGQLAEVADEHVHLGLGVRERDQPLLVQSGRG